MVALQFSNVREFNRELDEFIGKDVPRALVAFQKKIVLEALSRIVRRTPVDTGHARGNWQVTIDVSTEEELDALDRAGDGTIIEGLARLAGLGFGKVVFITNNAPYILALEGGHSGQAATGMVEVTFAELRSMFDTQE